MPIINEKLNGLIENLNLTLNSNQNQSSLFSNDNNLKFIDEYLVFRQRAFIDPLVLEELKRKNTQTQEEGKDHEYNVIHKDSFSIEKSQFIDDIIEPIPKLALHSSSASSNSPHASGLIADQIAQTNLSDLVPVESISSEIEENKSNLSAVEGN
jgi:hypothetical protein